VGPLPGAAETGWQTAGRHNTQFSTWPLGRRGGDAALLETIYRLTGHNWKGLKDVPDPASRWEWPEGAKEPSRSSGT